MSRAAPKGRPALARSKGFLAVASDGPLGKIEMTRPPKRADPDYLVVRTGRFPRVLHPIIPTALVVAAEPRRRRVYLRGRMDQLEVLGEELVV